MSDPKPETPQDADRTETVPTASTQHLPAHEPGTTAWTTWVPASEQHHAPAPTWSPPPGGTPWTPPPLPESTRTLVPAAEPTGLGAATPAPAPAPTSAPTPPAPDPTPAHHGAARQGRPQVTYLPPPSGPNWGLVVAGLACALLGLIGIVTRRRRG
jgi:hypothetical protein